MARQDEPTTQQLGPAPTVTDRAQNLASEPQAQVPAFGDTFSSTSFGPSTQPPAHKPSLNSEGVTMSGLYKAIDGQESRRWSAMDDDSDIWEVPSGVSSPVPR
ncbi:hypothetical protein BDW74DRAFT_173943 [Aspergillus multicolor]|uniref:uncharacterized protein n=1 Tax=Aspergillus multicolor TaxID=41759 RepID=UPI003CCDD20F